MVTLFSTYSFWWIIICLAVGIGYAWIQYTKISPWSKSLNSILAALRILLVSLICFFLLEPYIQRLTNYFQKPLVIIAVDTSKSIILNSSTSKNPLLPKIKEIEKLLETKGFDVTLLDINANEIKKIDSLKFNANSTNLSNQLKRIKNEYGILNLSTVILFSDGIFNEGFSPLAIESSYPIYTVGLGDTSAIKDIAIKRIRHNSTVLEGNNLLLEVQSQSKGISMAKTKISVYKKGKLVAQQPITLTKNSPFIKSLISVPILEKGKQSLTIYLHSIAEEFTELNNKKTIYFDVINRQKKILLLTEFPHPDLKAIKSSLEKNNYYTVDLAYKMPKKTNYDLIILHQYPSKKTTLIDKKLLLKSSNPKWFIIGNSNDTAFLNKLNIFKSINLDGRGSIAKSIVNPNFNSFQISSTCMEWIASLPPIVTPNKLIISNASIEALLIKKTNKTPLLFFSETNGERVGLLIGTNSWKWKLDEYKSSQTHENFDELITKTTQYLSNTIDKKNFSVKPHKKIYREGEDIFFNIESYNTIFQHIEGNTVNLSLVHENGEKIKHSFLSLNEESFYKVNGLPEGVYSYTASTEIKTEKRIATGQFIVKNINKEAINLLADFNLLQKIATKTHASFYTFSHLNELMSDIENLTPTSIIHTSKKNNLLMNSIWVLSLLLLLASSEWTLRKIYGGY